MIDRVIIGHGGNGQTRDGKRDGGGDGVVKAHGQFPLFGRIEARPQRPYNKCLQRYREPLI
ncbi:hypothetical protein MACH24_11600 [Erythrobacter sp. Dej080120_24]|nr:hypothetical protein MACH24_11600 [Erythrobacter sp. Dej080120_24]